MFTENAIYVSFLGSNWYEDLALCNFLTCCDPVFDCRRRGLISV